MTTLTQTEAPDAALAELARRGADLYDTTLKPHLEPAHNGEVVAVHPDTGDFTLARSATAARRTLRSRCPEGLIWSRTVGPETRHSLLRRVLGAGARSSERGLKTHA